MRVCVCVCVCLHVSLSVINERCLSQKSMPSSWIYIFCSYEEADGEREWKVVKPEIFAILIDVYFVPMNRWMIT